MSYILPRGLPALLMMLIIFLFSSQPSSDLPNFNWADEIVKKVSHLIGCALLVLSYWYVFRMREDKRWLAWLCAVLYAVTDEIHQSFVPGRHSTVWDVLVFDNLGAMISLWIASNRMKNN